jgi:hypothetical protein
MPPKPKVAKPAKPAPTIPREGKRAFYIQRRHAKLRGIPFTISLAEWWAWWQVDAAWERRGRGAGLVMARRGDTGPYSLSNVYCTTGAENVRDGHLTRRARKMPPALPWCF